MKSVRNSKGFSLTELVISLGISTILASAMGYLIVKTVAENQKTKSSLEIERFGREIKQKIFQVGRSCADRVSFVTPIPVGQLNGGAPVTVPVRIILSPDPLNPANAEIIQAGSRSRAGLGYEIAEANFARAEFMGRDVNGSSLFQGFIEIRARIGASGMDDGKLALKNIIVGTMMARVGPNGAFQDCFSNEINPNVSICNSLGLEFDNAKGTCRWEMDMNPNATAGNCNDDNPMVGILNGGKKCDRPSTDYCLNSRMMTEFRKGRAICSEPPPDLPQPMPPGPALPPGPVPTPPAPPAPPPVVTPAAPPPANPAPPPAPTPSNINDVTAPPTCSKTNARILCEAFCYDFMFGGNCSSSCASASGADEACAVVESNTTPPPLVPPSAPPVNPPPPRPTPPPASSCSCGGTIIAHGQYCGYCYRETAYEPDLWTSGRRLPINVREDSYQCNNGALVYSPTPNPNRGFCPGGYETW